MENRTQILIGVSIALIVIVGGWSLLAYGTVDEGEVAVEENWGEATGEVYESGNFWVGHDVGPVTIPNGFAYGTDRITVEPVTMTENVEALSADGQDIEATVSITYQLDAEHAHSFYSDSETSGPFEDTDMWEERVGERAISSAVNDGAASVSTIQMLEQLEEEDVEDGTDISVIREQLQDEVEEQLLAENEELSPEINIVEVRVEDTDLSNELDQALENIATERAEAERQIIDAEGDAEAEIERAEGQAEAFETLVEEYESVENALAAEYIEAIHEDDGTIILGTESGIPMIEVDTESGETSAVDPDEDDFFEEGD